jgi:hypothetical protein
MALSDIVRGVASKAGRVVAGAGVYTASILGAVGSAKAADRNIYPTNHATTPWTINQIDRFIDPVTCTADGGGPYGTPCPVAGENVVLTDHADGITGDYHVPGEVPSRSLRFRHNDVNFIGNGNVRIIGSSADISQVLVRTYTQGTTIAGIVFIAGEGTTNQVGVFAESGFTPENPVTVTGNEFHGFDKGGSWNNIVATGDNSTAGFKFTNNFVSRVFSGLIFNKGPDGVDSTKIRGLFANNLVEFCAGVGYRPLFYGVPAGMNGRTTAGVEAPGIGETTGNIFEFSDGVPLDPIVMGPFLSLAVPRTQSVGVPAENVEFLVGKNPPDGITYLGTLDEFFPAGNNIAGINPDLDVHRKPKENSLIVLSRKAGPNRPAGDAVGEVIVPGYECGDWQITDSDLRDFARIALDNPPIIPGSLVPKKIRIHDADEDFDVDMDDYAIIVPNITGLQPDCDGNGIGDWEEAQTLGDLSDILVNRANPPLSQGAIASNRFLSVNPNTGGLATAIRVTPTSMPQGYDNLVGRSWYVGPEITIGESGSSAEPVAGFGTFKAARLQCTPHYAVWGTNDLKVTGDAIIPRGTYSIQNLGDGCISTNEANYSTPLSANTVTSRGDIIGVTSQDLPEGVTNINDVLEILKKFSNAPGAFSKYRIDMEPATLDFQINVSDALDGIKGFAGLPYEAPVQLCP